MMDRAARGLGDGPLLNSWSASPIPHSCARNARLARNYAVIQSGRDQALYVRELFG
jgi:hypothetical protein